jgi:TolB-like protein
LIALLIKNRSRLVSRNAVFETIWADKVVSETTLNSRIKTARKLLGDDGKTQKYIRTIHKKGFRFVAEVIVDDNNSSKTSNQSGNDANPDLTSLLEKSGIAVLPFENLSGDPTQNTIADGIAHEILTTLASIPNLLVISRNFSFVYKDKAVNVIQIGRELIVDCLLEVSIYQTKDRIRVTIQLIETKAGSHLWTERYDRDFSDLFTVQDEIAREVVIALQTELGFDASLVNFQGGTSSHEAWKHSLKGIEKYNLQNRNANAEG